MIVEFAGVRPLSISITETDRGPLRAALTFDADPRARAGKLAFGGRSVAGILRNAGESRGRFAAEFVAGAGGWSRTLAPRFFDGPIRYSRIVALVAAEVGERVRVAPAIDRECRGYWYAGGAASAILEGHAWHVAADGVTEIGGPRERRRIPAGELRTEIVDPGAGLARGVSETGIRVGDVLEVGGGVEVGEVAIGDGGTWSVTLAGRETLRGALARPRVLDALPPRQRVGSAYTAPGAPAVGVSSAPTWAGPGVTAEAGPGGRVVVAFEGGDPGAPLVVAADGAPAARYAVRVVPGATVDLYAGAPVPLALGAPTASAVADIASALAAIATTLTGLGAPLSPTALAAIGRLTGAPTAIPSRVVRGE